MENIDNILKIYAEKYETEEFLPADPSWFMHQVEGADNQEVTAFIASCLSYGSRKQFMPPTFQTTTHAFTAFTHGTRCTCSYPP